MSYLRATSHPEFDGWRWHDYWAPIEEVIDFKRCLSSGALSELSRFLRDPETPEEFKSTPTEQFNRLLPTIHLCIMITHQYSESSITVLKGLEPVKERPGMYNVPTAPPISAKKSLTTPQMKPLAVLPNHIHVEIHPDGSLSVRDNGRGIPVGFTSTRKHSYRIGVHPFTRRRQIQQKRWQQRICSGDLHMWAFQLPMPIPPFRSYRQTGSAKFTVIVFAGGDVIEPVTQIGQCAQ